MSPRFEVGPGSKGQRAVLTTSHSESTTVFQGPLPPPHDLEKYNQVLPGAADRIVAMAENQAKHRFDMERLIVDRGLQLQGRGQTFGFILCGSTLVGGFVLIALNKDVTGIISLVAALTALVGSHIFSRKKPPPANQ